MSANIGASAFAVTALPTSRNQLRRVAQRTPLIRPSLKSTGRQLICASSGEPPRTKSSFYKNPSKAIEKGGGFYFPGLRGPRLRIFVTVVGFGLLSINHVASIRSSMTIPPSFTVSEVGALLALFSVLSSAYLDITRAAEEEMETGEPVIEPQPLSQQTNGETSEGAVSTVGSGSSSNNMMEVFEWVARVAVRMTEVDGVFVFRGDALIFSSVPLSKSSECGEVVARVAREDKSLFVDDTSRLPEGVDVPFLDPTINKWSLFLVPILSGELVVVFSSALKANEKGKIMSAGDREWLKQCSNRIQVEM